MIKKKNLLKRIEILESVQNSRYNKSNEMNKELIPLTGKLHYGFNDNLIESIKQINDRLNKQGKLLKEISEVLEIIVENESKKSINNILGDFEVLLKELFTNEEKPTKKVTKPKKTETKEIKTKKETSKKGNK